MPCCGKSRETIYLIRVRILESLIPDLAGLNTQDVTIMLPLTAVPALNTILDAQGLRQHFIQNNALRWQLENISLINGYDAGNGGSIIVNVSSTEHVLTMNSCIVSGKYRRL